MKDLYKEPDDKKLAGHPRHSTHLPLVGQRECSAPKPTPLVEQM